MTFFAFFILFILFSRRRSEAAVGKSGVDGGWGGGGIVIFRVPNSLQGCDRWGERRGILYIKVLVVQWKDIRPWQPLSSFRVQHSSEGHSLFRGCRVDLTAQRSSDGVQRSSEGCSVAHKGVA